MQAINKSKPDARHDAGQRSARPRSSPKAAVQGCSFEEVSARSQAQTTVLRRFLDQAGNRHR